MKTKTLLILSVLVFCMALLLSLWGVGLVHFVHQVSFYANQAAISISPNTAAVIVLTGGSDRVQRGVALLNAQKGKKLFISGVYPGVKAKQFLDGNALPLDLMECCVVLDHVAEDTLGNADEAAAFMKAENYSSLQLVTSHYHMPRSLLLFRHAMPDKIIVPHPVLPEIVDLSSWWERAGTRNLLIAEYHKYMIVKMGLYLGDLF